MKRKQFGFALFLAILMLLFLTPLVNGQEKIGTITIQSNYQNQVISGGDLSIYQVARLSQDNPFAYEFFPAFQSAPISLLADQLADDTSEQARILTGYLEGVQAVFKTEHLPDKPLVVSGLEQGVYLLVQNKPAEGYEPLRPFLLTIPKDGQYTINAIEKMSPSVERQKTIVPTPSSKRPSELPFTGQVWWPIYVLLSLGTFCLVYSFIGRSRL